eukprot:Pgem_evm5s17627
MEKGKKSDRTIESQSEHRKILNEVQQEPSQVQENFLEKETPSGKEEYDQEQTQLLGIEKEKTETEDQNDSILDDDFPDSELRREIIDKLHSSYLNFERLQCLLCQKKLKSPEILTKHSTISKLHLDNLEPKIMEMYRKFQVDKPTRGEGYRDRALERRTIYGQPQIPIREDCYQNRKKPNKKEAEEKIEM